MHSINKKGSIKIVVGMILFIAVAIALLSFTNLWGAEVKDSSPKQTCRLTVEAKAKSRVPILSPEGAVKLNCPAEFEDVFFKDEEQVKEFLAQRMSFCWYQFAEGRPIFATEKEDSKLQCGLCGVYSFSESLRQQYPNGIFGFDVYLRENKVPGSDVSYMEYFTRSPTAKQVESGFSYGQGAIDLQQDYAIYIATGTRTSFGQTAESAGYGAGAGAVAGGAVGLALAFIPGVNVAVGAFVLIGAGVGGLAGASAALPDGQITTLMFTPYNKLQGQCKSLT